VINYLRHDLPQQFERMREQLRSELADEVRNLSAEIRDLRGNNELKTKPNLHKSTSSLHISEMEDSSAIANGY